MKNLWLSIVLLTVTAGLLRAQPEKGTTGGYKVPFEVVDGDTLPVIVMDEGRAEEKLDAEALKKQREWNKLVYDVMKVYPLAQQCSDKLKELNQNLENFDKKRDRKKFLREQEDIMKEEFESRLKDLTFRQGKLLIKLIDRQTGYTSFNLIKEYKNGMSAFFWNSFASMWGMNLKEKYDASKEQQVEAVLAYLGYK